MMKSFFFGCIFCACSLSAVSQPGVSMPSVLDNAVYLYSIGNYREALNLFNFYIQENPKDPTAFFFRGMCFLAAPNLEKAEADLRKAVKLNPSLPQSNFGMGYLMNEKKDYKEAIKWYDKAIDLNPFYTESYNSRGVAKQNAGLIKEAILDYNKALSLDTTYALAYNNRGAARYYNQNVAAPHRNDVMLAIADFTKALHFDQGLELARRNRAYANTLIDQDSLALLDIDKLISLTDNPEYYFMRARIKYKSENYPGAIEDFKSALQSEPLSSDIYVEMGNAKSRLGYHEEAIKDQRRAMENNPEYAGLACYNIACNYSLMKQKQDMLKFLQLSKDKGYFYNRQIFEHFLNDTDFDNFRKDDDFLKFTDSIRKVLSKKK